MKNKKVLFIVEGPDERKELRHKLLEYISLDVKECNIITYSTSIYELYDLITKPENEGISLPSILIKEKRVNVDPNFQLDSTFASTYLVFDFDPQYHKFNMHHLRYFASRFNNDTEEGLLLLNYPMFESLFDINDLDDLVDFLNKTVKVSTSEYYKSLVKQTTCLKSSSGHPFKHINDLNTFKKIAKLNLNKYLHMLDKESYDGIDQEKILNLQLNSVIKNNEVSVLNTMCLLYFEYNNVEE